MAATPKSRANRATTAEQQVKCYEMRLTGATIRAIAAETNLAVGTVHARINAEADARVLPLAETLRKQELDRLDDLFLKAYRVLTGDHIAHSNGRVIELNGQPLPDDGPRLAAIDRLLRVMERRAKLLGLDGPTQVEVTHHHGDLDLDAELDAFTAGAQTATRGQGNVAEPGPQQPDHPPR